MSTKARRIGGDWVESVDPNSGKVYYANLATKQTSWTMPEEVKKMQEQTVAKKKDLKQQLNTMANNNNTSKGSTSTSGGPKDQWLERQDPKTGRIYYYNPKLKQTAWNKPESSISALDGGNALGKGAWVPRLDPRTNRTYYYNQVTRMTSWVNPDEDGASKKEDKKKSTRSGIASRMSKRISFQPKATDQPAYEPEETPAAPTNRTSARASIRLGAMPTPGANNRLSMAGMARERAREKKQEITGELHDENEEVATPTLDDRFAKLRALRERAAGGENEEPEEEVVEKQIDLDDLAAEALADVTYDLKFESYAEQYFNMTKKGWGKKNMTMDKIISWKPEKVKTSLHPLKDPALVHDAILSFQNILCYMGDKSTKNPMNNANKIFKILIRSPEELRDEVYCQLVKQTNFNPDATSTLRGWELMAICAGLFPPSDKLEKYLLSYMRRATESQT